MAEHEHVCKYAAANHQPAPGGCVCACGAVLHHLGWQEITVLPPPKSAESVFDVEEYRADLQRRMAALTTLAEVTRSRWNYLRNAEPFSADTARAHREVNRLINKAQGLEIALSLLPKKEG